MSKAYIKVLHETTGTTISYDLKHVFGAHFLVIQTNFAPLDHSQLVERDWLFIEGISRMDSVGVYPDGSGYVIYFLHKGYNAKELLNSIETIFKNYFDENTIL